MILPLALSWSAARAEAPAPLQLVGGSAEARSIAVAEHGDLLVAGTVYGQPGGMVAFAARYAATGALRWWHDLPGAVHGELALGRDGEGRTWVAGTFRGRLQVGAVTLESAGGTDVFLVRFDPDGRPSAGHRLGGPGDDALGSLAVDGANLYLTGHFGAPLDLLGAPIAGVPAHAPIVVALDGEGRRRWHHRITEETGPLHVAANGGVVVLSGAYRGEVDPCFGEGIAPPGVTRGFLARIDPNDGSTVWSHHLGTVGTTRVAPAHVDPSGELAVAVTYDAPLALDGQPVPTGACTDANALVARVSPDGTWRWWRTAHAATLDEAPDTTFADKGMRVVPVRDGRGDVLLLVATDGEVAWDGPTPWAPSADGRRGTVLLAWNAEGRPLWGRALHPVDDPPLFRDAVSDPAGGVAFALSSFSPTSAPHPFAEAQVLALGTSWVLRAPAARAVRPPPTPAPPPGLLRWRAHLGVEGDREARHGYALAAADFDQDGDVELVSGDPSERVVRVWADGPDRPPISLDATGLALATGDLTSDGTPDLAVVSAREGAWLVQVFAGGPSGLSATPARIVEVPDDGAIRTPSLAIGDLTGDGQGDLVVGLPMEDGPGEVRAWAGGPDAPADPVRTWRGTRADARFGTAVAVCDLDGDRTNELVVGAPVALALTEDERVGNPDPHGAVLVYRDPAGAPRGEPIRLSPDGGYAFGDTVACAGDLDGDGVGDLAVGSPEPYGLYHAPHVGRAYVFAGGPDGPVATPRWSWETATPHLPTVGLAGADLDVDGFADLVVGAPGRTGHAALLVFRGGRGGLAETPAWELARDTSHGFGGALAAGDLDGDGSLELAVGVPGSARCFTPASPETSGREPASRGLVELFTTGGAR